MFLKKETRIGAAVALVVVLALTPAAPAGAAGWSGLGGAREWSGGIVPRVLSWLGLGPSPVLPKCDHGSSIDPNGCPRVDGARADDGSQIDPNGWLTKSDQGSQIDPDGLVTRSDHGSSIDPDGQH
jgi:hypothetical protein